MVERKRSVRDEKRNKSMRGGKRGLVATKNFQEKGKRNWERGNRERKLLYIYIWYTSYAYLILIILKLT